MTFVGLDVYFHLSACLKYEFAFSLNRHFPLRNPLRSSFSAVTVSSYSLSLSLFYQLPTINFLLISFPVRLRILILFQVAFLWLYHIFLSIVLLLPNCFRPRGHFRR